MVHRVGHGFTTPARQLDVIFPSGARGSGWVEPLCLAAHPRRDHQVTALAGEFEQRFVDLADHAIGGLHRFGFDERLGTPQVIASWLRTSGHAVNGVAGMQAGPVAARYPRTVTRGRRGMIRRCLRARIQGVAARSGMCQRRCGRGVLLDAQMIARHCRTAAESLPYRGFPGQHQRASAPSSTALWRRRRAHSTRVDEFSISESEHLGLQ